MRAMVLVQPKTPLEEWDIPIPYLTSHRQVLIQVEACGVCRTDLHIYDGELSEPKLPLILGHQVVGKVVEVGKESHRFALGQRVGVPWLGRSCEECSYCQRGEENLCGSADYTGYSLDGGFAEYCLADEKYLFPIPDSYSAPHAAPLLCAGLIGYRSLRLAGSGKRIGFYGFGSAAHILIQVARYQGKKVYSFTRPGDLEGQEFAKEMGAVWAGDSTETPPEELDAAIIFAPSGELVPLALQAVRRGGIVVCAGIHMSDIPAFPYAWLYGERVIRSVTNLTREDGEQFFSMLDNIQIKTTITSYPLEKANEALADLKEGRIKGAAVLDLCGNASPDE